MKVVVTFIGHIKGNIEHEWKERRKEKYTSGHIPLYNPN